jgi:ssDNA-binding Zn-finger/Zn-ribbon topoisomerase 1
LPTCPECKETINHLIGVRRTTSVHVITLDEENDFAIDDTGNDNYDEYQDTIESETDQPVPGDFYTFNCPECDFTIAKTSDAAETFLRSKEQVEETAVKAKED